jgi:hypothetical protein
MGEEVSWTRRPTEETQAGIGAVEERGKKVDFSKLMRALETVQY